MESEMSTADLAARLDGEIDRIDGLITVTASAETLVAVVDAGESVSPVREELLRLGIPDEQLEVEVIGDAFISYPVADARLERWFAEAGVEGSLDVGVSVREPRLNLTPRRVVVAVLILVVGYYVLSAVFFLLLMLLEGITG